MLPVLKHIPGHGRATADSHVGLPVVTAPSGRNWRPPTSRRSGRSPRCRMGMTAHVVFTAYDPVAPATTSVTMVSQVIRDSIGFEGLLMSDDVSMGALSGSLAERTRAALAAGCDMVLHCNGQLEEMQAVAAAAPPLAGDCGAARASGARRAAASRDDLDLGEARKMFAALLADGRPAGARMAAS